MITIESSQDSTLIDRGSGNKNRKVSSTLEAGALSLKETTNNGIYIGSLLSKFLYDPFAKNRIPIEVYSDNKNTRKKRSFYQTSPERRLSVDIGEVLRLLEQKKIIDIKWISTKEIPADALTKHNANIQKVPEISA